MEVDNGLVRDAVMLSASGVGVIFMGVLRKMFKLNDARIINP